MITRQTSLSGNIVSFCRFLRYKDFAITAEEEALALSAMQFVDYSKRSVFSLALKTVLCRNRKELNDFDHLFNEYWKELGKAIESKVKTRAQPSSKQGTKDSSFKSLKSWLNGNRNNETEQTAFYSIAENLSKKDFSAIPADQLDELMGSIKAIAKRLAAQINRRYEKSEKIHFPDLRRTLRKNMRHGGNLLEIAFKKPKPNRIKLVLLCDVSKSMDLYTGFLLQFMVAFQHVFRRIKTFTFSTSLQHITHVLKHNDFNSALNLLGDCSDSWSGGTRIGESLDEFIRDYSSGVLDKRTTVIILSDGCDTGSITLLTNSMKLIHTKCRKVIWLNPLAGMASYSPDVAGMQAAMAYVDVFAPVHNIDSFRKLSRWL